MAWDVVSQTANVMIPASRMNQLQDNFAAMAAQNSGAPVVTFPNSIMNANAGVGVTGVGSFGSLNASSGMSTTGVGSFGSLVANSGMSTTGVGSFGRLWTQHGLATESYGAYSFTNVEKVLLTASAGVRGNTVLLFGYMEIAEATLATTNFRVRVGSLGGQQLAAWNHIAPALAISARPIHAYHAPSSGPMSWVLTGIGSVAEMVTVYQLRLIAVEVSQ